MIDVFHAQPQLRQLFQSVNNERELISLVATTLHEYCHATRVKHSELDIAFAATGGPTQWVNVDNISIDFTPSPGRRTDYGDILVEQAYGYVNLSTPAGFIPLVDIIEDNGSLRRKVQVNSA